ncbi:731_t:CDS:2 [Entrophospora sp. SA101]|nr:731_t:CDS:2 [Entrophospora sp. SA101]
MSVTTDSQKIKKENSVVFTEIRHNENPHKALETSPRAWSY